MIPESGEDQIIIQSEGITPYQESLKRMQELTSTRTRDSADEIWTLQHEPVYTLGQAGKKEHLLSSTNIPVIQSDRGGQITYHGPGQLIIYLLLNLKRKQLTVRQLVSMTEDCTISVLNDFNIQAHVRPGAPGVYTGSRNQGAKIASLGFRIRRGFSYHGLALNIDLDTKPFEQINPCGYPGLQVTTMARETGTVIDFESVRIKLLESFLYRLGYNQPVMQTIHQTS
jgi:lipoyl(octanoyl) transferase